MMFKRPSSHRKLKSSFLSLLVLLLAIGSITFGAINYSAPGKESSSDNLQNQPTKSNSVIKLLEWFSGSAQKSSLANSPVDSFTVNNSGDTADAVPGDGICADAAQNCTLRAAIQEANAKTGVDTINFSLTTSATIQLDPNLSNAELVISEAVNINGPGARLLTIRGGTNTAGGIFNITSAVNATLVNIKGLTIADSGDRGINNDGELKLSEVVVKGNAVGIYNTKKLILNGVLVSDNSEGGLFFDTLSEVNISNTTITNNTAANGGGINSKSANVILNNVTISHNNATGSGAGKGGGFYYDSTTAQGPKIRNSIIANNTAATAGPDIFSVSSAPPDDAKFVSKGNNLIGISDTNIGFAEASNNDNVGTSGTPANPLLGPLQNNGGAIDTRALLNGSPARDTGNNCVTSTCSDSDPETILDTDQRGTNFPRNYNNSNVDKGAFESFYPVAAIQSFGPDNWGTGGGEFELTVNGTNFVADSVVNWNGQDRPTTFISNTQIKAQIQSSDVNTGGQVPVTVVNPTPGGGASPAQNFTVVDCTFSISPTSQTFSAGGGNITVNVTTQNGCAWTAASNNPFLSVSNGTSGTGSGTVNISAAANAGLARNGTVTIAGQTFTVSQDNGCTYSLDPTSATHPAESGDYNFALTTSDPICNWTVTDDASWLTVNNASGNDSATINYSVTANTGVARSGNITVTGAVSGQISNFTVNQDNGCAFVLNPTSTNITAAGGTGSFDVTASTGCEWTATSNSPWITVDSGTPGDGNGTINFTVAANNGPARNGKITVNGQDFNISQDSGCGFVLSETSINVAMGGGNGSVNVTTTAGCEWTAVSNDSWLTVTGGASENASGTVNFTVEANNGLARTGTMTIAGHTFTVNQDNGCGYFLNPVTQGFPNTETTGATFTVGTSNANCTWTAASNNDWLTITNGASGTGNGTVTFNVGANAGPSRSGTISVTGALAEQTADFTVNQSNGCTYALNPTSASHPAASGSYSFALTASDPACSWTAVDDSSWIAVTNDSGTGSATINYTIEANNGLARNGKITVNGQEFIVNQANGCSYTLNPTSADFPAAGGTNGTFAVTVSNPNCTWTATTTDNWITITSGATGTGDGTINYTITANTGPQRTGKITVGGQADFNITQDNGCIYSLNPTNQSFPNGGGTNGSFNVTTSNPSCVWTAAVENGAASWITITGGENGTGAGTVNFTVAPNNGLARTGKIIAGGQEFTVNQANGCVYTLNPTSQNYPGTATQSATFTVETSNPNCTWNAASNNNWLSITNGLTGTGNGTVTFDLAANTGLARNGTISVSGAVSGQTATFTAHQAIGCTYTLSTNSTNIAAAGGNGSFNVTSSEGCEWTAVSNASWITINSGTPGSGNGSLNFTVASNAGVAREGTITVTGTTGETLTFTVSQANGCSYSLNPTSVNAPTAGGNGSFDITTSDPTCTWTVAAAPANTSWISISSGTNGIGNGTVNFTVGANNGIARIGSINVNGAVSGQTASFAINQANGCTYTLNPTSQNFTSTGGTNGTFAVTASNTNCTWTAATGDAWITVNNGTNRTGSGNVNFSVTANAGIARTGTISVNDGEVSGQPINFTVNQDNGCTYSLNPTSASHPFEAGNYSFALTTSDPTCTWTATDDTSWITVTNTTGTGNATINYSLEANNGLVRSGKITVNGHDFNITQANGCSYFLNPVTQGFPNTGATGATFSIGTSNANCTWTATANTNWLAVTNGTSGTGPGTVTFDVGANNGLARSGTISIKGALAEQVIDFTANQSNGCTYTLNPTNQNFTAAGGMNATFAVTTSNSNCTWTPISNNNWITVASGTEVTGNGTVTYSVAANVGVSRTGTISVNGAVQGQTQTFSVTQDNGCTYALNPTSASHPAASGSYSFALTASDPACSWTAVDDSSWIAVTNDSGTGSATINYTIEANNGLARNGKITVNGQEFIVNQANGCSYTLNPTSADFPAAGGTNGTFAVTVSNPNCTWTPNTTNSWITLGSSSTVTGNGNVTYSVAANNGMARTGIISINGQAAVFAVNQANGCVYTLNPTNQSFPSTSGNDSFTVTTSNQNCTWTATTSSNNWVSITNGASGTGNGTVNYAVQANAGPARSTTISVNGAVEGQTVPFTINQSSGCFYVLNPTSVNVQNNGQTASFTITPNTPTCSWTATPDQNWITVNGTNSGSGNATISYTVQANATPQRTGKIVVQEPNSTNKAEFVITQADGCTYTLTPETANFPASAGTGNFSVSAGAGCQWTAATSDSWVTISSGTPGSGNGTINFSITVNTGLARIGIITVNGMVNGQPVPKTYTINQANGCSVTLNPVSANHPAAGASGSFQVTASAQGCTWSATTAAANISWISITGTTGSPGNGTVNYTVAANVDAQRTGKIIVTTPQNGQTFDFNITQGDGCTYTLAPTSTYINQNGGGRSFNVTTSGTGCTWSTVSNDSWITISSGATGTGNGTVNLSITANSGPERVGTATLTGANGQTKTFTVNQISLVVSNRNDSGAGSLRKAISNANIMPTNDTIIFQQGLTGTITLTTGEIQIDNNGSLDIQGPGADRLIISGNNSSRIFYINSAVVTISGLKLTNGNGVGSGNNEFEKKGGAIFVYFGSLVLDRSEVTVNTNTFPANQSGRTLGGGIYYYGGTAHQILNSTIAGNTGTFGGGYFNQNGSISITNSTIAFNTANEGGAVYSVGDTIIRSSTITENTARTSGNFGGGIYNVSGVLNFGNTIIAGNTGPEITFESGNFQSAGNNLIGDSPGDADNTKGFVIYQPSDIKDTPPMLATLEMFGGGTATMPLLPGSPAINAGNNNLATQSDQRGAPRIINNTVDIGAYEYNIEVTPTSPNLPPTTVGTYSYYQFGAHRANGTNPGEQFEFFVVNGFSPQGMNLAQVGGLLNGPPTVSGVFNFTIKALGTDGMAGANNYTVLVTCQKSLSPATSPMIPASGETRTVSVTAVNGCTWNVIIPSGNPWISASPLSGNGNGTVNYTVAANTGPQRTVVLNIADSNFSVTQADGCSFTVNPTSSDNVPSGGTTGNFTVTTVGGCQWSASSNVPWITVTNGTNRTGGGTLNYTIAANPGQARSGKITVTGVNGATAEFNITQGTGCSYSLSAQGQNFPIGGGSNNAFNITTGTGCAWTANVNPLAATWISITSGSSGSGPGAVQYSVAPNAGARRTAVITVMDKSFTVTQNGKGDFDFDGDGKADEAVYRPSEGAWYLNRSTAGFTGMAFGISTDKVTPADFDGDGKTDIAVYRDGNWYILRSNDGSFTAVPFGAATDLPRPADFDGDGKADINVFRPSDGGWYRLNSSNGQFVGIIFGAAGDIPTPADFDGDGKADINVFRPSDGGWYRLNSSNGQFIAQQFGANGDLPTPADFDGDGKADINVYRQSDGGWYRLNSTSGQFISTQFGASSDLPVVADYDGDGKADICVFRPSDGGWYRLNSSNGQFHGVIFGASTDKAIQAFYLP